MQMINNWDCKTIKRLVTLGLALALTGIGDAANACGSCAQSVKLTKVQLACFERDVEAYLSEKADPVIVTLLGCAPKKQAVPAKEIQGHAAPILKPIIDPRGDASAAAQVYFLTKQQILCLRDNLSKLKKSNGNRVVFEFRNCER